MPLAVLADAELVVVTYLKNQADVAALVSDRISTELPNPATLPRLWVKLPLAGLAVPRRLDAPVFDIDARAETKQAAGNLARVAHAAMWDASNVTVAGGVITGVETLLSPHWAPDPPTGTPGYRFSVRVFIRPA